MTLDELAFREEIRDVVARYCRGADRLDWDLVRACFHPDARDEHGLYDGDIEGMIRFFSIWSGENYRSAMPLLGNQLVALEGDVAVSEAYCVSFLRLDLERASSPRVAALFEPAALAAVLAEAPAGFVDLNIGVRFVGAFEKRDGGRWLIAHRVVVREWDRLDPVRATMKLPAANLGRRDGFDTIFRQLDHLRGGEAA